MTDRPFRGAIDRGGETGGAGAHHGDVVDRARIELGRDAEAQTHFGVARALEHVAIGADHQRQVARLDAETLHHGARFLVGVGVEHGIRVAVARQEALQPDEVGRAAAVDQQRARAACLKERDAAQNEGAHEDLADLGGADHQRANMRGIERQRGAAVGTGAAAGDRAAAGE